MQTWIKYIFISRIIRTHHEQAMPRNRAKRDAKNSRSAERGCSSVLPPPNRRRMVGARNPAPPLAGYVAQSRKARCKNSRSAERGCFSVLPPPHTPLKHPAMFLLCIHIPQNSCTIFVILLCRGRLIAANNIYLISIVRLPHVGRAATKILSRLQIKGNTAQFPPCGLSTAPAAAARHLRCQNAR